MKIGVVGLGLIGGSVFKKLKELSKYEVVGVSRSVNGIDGVSSDYAVLKNCDVVFVCTPMNVTLEILEKLESVLGEETIVTDVCSLKGFVSKRGYKFKFIPSHPMAGTENKGWASSFPELFKGAKWVITPLKGEYTDEQEVLENIIEELGAKIVITNPEEHDKAVALISHAPMVIAQAMCDSVFNNTLAQELASSGFRDTTRLALSNLEMAEDMVNLNKDNIETAIESYNNSITDLLSGDYLKKAEKIKNFRQNLYD